MCGFIGKGYPMTSCEEDISLMAHLMRRAGFGSTREHLEQLVKDGYEETVDRLIDVSSEPPLDEGLLYRYHPITESPDGVTQHSQAPWLYRLLNTKRLLEEKMVLFWHHVFATGNSKVDNGLPMLEQLQMFRDYGMGSYKELLIQLSKNPAMIFWLDNNENHKNAPNENWGRELLELFSMGVGNYTEEDVLECSRAFTGWTLSRKIPTAPYGGFPWKFEFRPEEHDFEEKTFLGNTGRFNGEDVIDIILKHPATSQFICRHLYNFFVADEPQVPSWSIEPPRDPEAVNLLAKIFVDSNHEIKPVLHALFNSDFFKEAKFQKVRSPIEVVVGTLKLIEDLQGPDPRLETMSREPGFMGQDMLDPPSVEGWHTGKEWINSGALVKRVNFVADRIADTNMKGVQNIVKRVAETDQDITPDVLVDRCLDQMGPLEVSGVTREELVAHAATEKLEDLSSKEGYAGFSIHVASMLALIASTKEYQFG